MSYFSVIKMHKKKKNFQVLVIFDCEFVIITVNWFIDKKKTNDSFQLYVCVCVHVSQTLCLHPNCPRLMGAAVVSGASLSSLQLHLSQAAETHIGTRCFKVNPFKWLSLCYLVRSMCSVTTRSNGNLARQETKPVSLTACPECLDFCFVSLVGS